MIEDQRDIYDIKCAWLIFLANVSVSLSRLKKECPTICPSETARSSKSVTDSMSMLEKESEGLALKLMDLWDINQKGLSEWIN